MRLYYKNSVIALTRASAVTLRDTKKTKALDLYTMNDGIYRLIEIADGEAETILNSLYENGRAAMPPAFRYAHTDMDGHFKIFKKKPCN